METRTVTRLRAVDENFLNGLAQVSHYVQNVYVLADVHCSLSESSCSLICTGTLTCYLTKLKTSRIFCRHIIDFSKPNMLCPMGKQAEEKLKEATHRSPNSYLTGLFIVSGL